MTMPYQYKFVNEETLANELDRYFYLRQMSVHLIYEAEAGIEKRMQLMQNAIKNSYVVVWKDEGCIGPPHCIRREQR